MNILFAFQISMCDKSRNTWLCVHWQWNTLEWCQLNALQASPVVHLVTPLSCVSLSMNTQPSVPAIETWPRCLRYRDNEWCEPLLGMNLANAWWRHQMEILSTLLALCVGNSPVTGGFPSQRPVTRSFDVLFDVRLDKRFSKQLRRHRTHYDAIVMDIEQTDWPVKHDAIHHTHPTKPPFSSIQNDSYVRIFGLNSKHLKCE